MLDLNMLRYNPDRLSHIMASPFLQSLEMMYCDDYMPQQSHMCFKSRAKSEVFFCDGRNGKLLFFLRHNFPTLIYRAGVMVDMTQF